MPYIVGGKRFHQSNLPGPKLAPERHHFVQTPITVTSEAASEGSALYKAEHMLAAAAGDAEEVICIETLFSPAEMGVACVMTGVPIKHLDA